MSITVRGYGRASTAGQVMSTSQQEAKVLDACTAFKTLRPLWADSVWGGFMADEATSRVSCFRERHAASLLLAASKPGDVILVSNYDRIFANVVDVCETLPLLDQMKVGLIILDTDIDTTQILGAFCFKILALVKELDVVENRRRTRESIAHRRRLGRPYGRVLVGWKNVLMQVPGIPKPQRYTVPDHAARRLAREILSIKERGKFTYDHAYQFCNRLGPKQKNGCLWTAPTFAKWCRAAESDFVLPNGSHEAAPIPADAKPYLVETISTGD